jgi:histidine ammonia-lyase
MLTPMAETPLLLDGRPLSFAEVESVARHGRAVRVGPAAAREMARSRALVERTAGGAEAVYGVNTGFGSLGSRRIEPQALRDLQVNLVRSHAAGVGEPLAEEVVRAMLLVLAAGLCRGRSGVRPQVAEQVVELLNRGITPVVPGRGSVGASGDLAPLAHAALVLIGEGEARHGGRTLGGAEALAAAGLKPLALEAKEGIALVNGTHLMCAMGALALADVERLAGAAVAAAAMAIDACRATDTFLDPRLHAARGQPGQARVAEALRRLVAGSQVVMAHKTGDPRVQDPYSLRASPQVLGAAFDAIEYARGTLERELGAVTDNPLVFAETGEIVSGGNFHGMPLAIALDVLAIALCHVAGIAERRVFWVLSGADAQNPVRPFLSPQPGLHSGLMVAQYAAAACCNELQTLAAPASPGNIPTSAGMEDYNSMGATAAHQARAAVELATHVVAIELLVMAEAMEHQRPLRSGAGVERVHQLVRAAVPRLEADRPPAPDIAAIAGLIRQGAFQAV